MRKRKEKKIDVREAYERLSELVKETQALERRQKELGLSEPEYFMLVAMEEKLGKSEKLIHEVRSLWQSLEKSGKLFPGWNRKPTIVKEVGKEIRRFLRKRLPLKERDEAHEKIVKGLREL